MSNEIDLFEQGLFSKVVRESAGERRASLLGEFSVSNKPKAPEPEPRDDSEVTEND